MSFVPIFWNTETQQNLENKTSKIYGSHIAYKKQGYDWTSISNDVQTDLSVSTFAGNVQFPTTAQGWMDICFNSEYSAKRQITEGNWSNTEDEFNMRMRTDTPTNSVGIIHPDKPWQVIYYNAFGQGVNLIYGVWRARQCRVEHVIEITEMPAGDSEYITYDFYVESTDATAFIGNNYNERPWDGNVGDSATVDGFSVFIAKGDDFNTPRGSVLRTPACWWTNLDGTFTKKDVKIDFEIQPDGITIKATKYVKRSDIAEALAQGSVYRADATFSPDANPETTSVDGLAADANNNLTWANLLLEAGSYSASSSATEVLGVGAKTTTNFYEYYKHLFFLFDTSSIGAGQQVDSATLRLWFDNQRSLGSLGLSSQLYSSSPGSNTQIVNGDYMALGSTPLTDSARDMESESFDVTEITQTLNSAGRNNIDMEGVTKMGLGVTVAHEGGSPTWNSGHEAKISVNMSESSGTSKDPLLTVNHSDASGPTQLVLRDRVKETTTSTGTGTINLAGAVTGFQDFVSAIDDNNECYYTILDANGTDWEVGIGTVTDASPDTLSRTTILESSNNDSGVALSSGTHTVFLTYPADKSVYRNTNDQIVATASGIVFSDSTVQTTAAAVSGDNISIFTNDAGYLTTESDTLQTVTDRGSDTTNSITSSGNITATTGILDVLDLTLLGNGSQPSHSEGVVFYDSENHTLSLYNDEADVTLQLGQEEFLRVRNNTGGTIYNGSGVRITGAHGASAPTVVPAIATTEEKSQVVGLATHDIENETFGYVTTYGIVNDVNTSTFSDGDELFLDASVSGNLTNVSPVIPNYKVRVGHVIRSHTNGSILVSVGSSKLGGGDAKVVNSSINLSGIPYYTEVANTNAGGMSSNATFLYDSGNNQLQLGSGVQLLNAVPGNTTNVLYNDGGTLKFNGSAVDTNTTYTAGTGITLNSTTFDIDPTLISGRTEITSADADYLLVLDADDSLLKKVDAGEFRGGRSVAGDTDNGVITWVTSDDTFAVEAGLTYTGGTLTATGIIDVTNVLDASDATGDTGAIRTEGGVSIAKKLYVGTDLDVDGTTNLDVVDIDGDVQLDGTLTVGVDGTGKDVKLYGDTTGSYLEWDQNEDRLNLVGGAYVNEAVPANDTPTAEDATVTLDLSLGNYHNISLGNNVANFQFTNAKRGQRFILRITQHASSAKTVAWTNVDSDTGGTAATVRWAEDITPTMSTSTSHTDVYGFLCTNNAGTNFDGFIIGQDLPD
jgi:hypothetical protein